jgi:hypothetical protein
MFSRAEYTDDCQPTIEPSRIPGAVVAPRFIVNESLKKMGAPRQ